MNMSVFALNPLTGMAALRDRAQDWILEKNLGWPDQPQVNKIDTHHHMVPNFYAKGIRPPHAAYTPQSRSTDSVLYSCRGQRRYVAGTRHHGIQETYLNTI